MIGQVVGVGGAIVALTGGFVERPIGVQSGGRGGQVLDDDLGGGGVGPDAVGGGEDDGEGTGGGIGVGGVGGRIDGAAVPQVPGKGQVAAGGGVVEGGDFAQKVRAGGGEGGHGRGFLDGDGGSGALGADVVGGSDGGGKDASGGIGVNHDRATVVEGAAVAKVPQVVDGAAAGDGGGEGSGVVQGGGAVVGSGEAGDGFLGQDHQVLDFLLGEGVAVDAPLVEPTVKVLADLAVSNVGAEDEGS